MEQPDGNNDYSPKEDTLEDKGVIDFVVLPWPQVALFVHYIESTLLVFNELGERLDPNFVNIVKGTKEMINKVAMHNQTLLNKEFGDDNMRD